MKKFIYKICKISEWNSAQKKKIFSGTKKDIVDGFIHLSNKNQVRGTLKKYYFKKAPRGGPVLKGRGVATRRPHDYFVRGPQKMTRNPGRG